LPLLRREEKEHIFIGRGGRELPERRAVLSFVLTCSGRGGGVESGKSSYWRKRRRDGHHRIGGEKVQRGCMDFIPKYLKKGGEEGLPS